MSDQRWCVLLAGLTLSAAAERMPPPLEFLAGMQALQETCAKQFPDMKDDAAALEMIERRDRPSDAELMRLLKTSTEYPEALRKAREQILKLPQEKIDTECKALHAAATRAPPGARP